MDSPYWKGPLPGVDVQRRYLWKTFRGKPNSIPGSARKCSASARNPVRLHPGMLFGFSPESCSTCPGVWFGLPRHTHSLSVFAAKREQSLTTACRERSRRERDPLAQGRCRPTGGATTPQTSWSWFSFYRTVLVLKPDLSTHGRCRPSGGMRPGPLLGLGDLLLFPPFHRSTKTVRLRSGLDDVRTVRHSIQQRLA